MLGFYVSASGAIQVHHGPLVNESHTDDDTLLLIPEFIALRPVCFGLDLFLPSIMLQTFTQKRI